MSPCSMLSVHVCDRCVQFVVCRFTQSWVIQDSESFTGSELCTLITGILVSTLEECINRLHDTNNHLLSYNK